MPIFHTTRVLMLVDIISIPVTSLPPPYALRFSATSSGWSLLWTVLNSTTPSTSKHTAQPWEHAWLHHTLTYSSPNLRQTHFHMRRTSHTPGGASSTTFSWSGPTQKTNYALLLLTSTTFTPLSNSLHPIQLHLFLFSTSRSHLTSLVKLRPISILNRQTNTNTFYNHRVTLYTRNEPFHSASLSDYDAYALPTKASHYAPMNSSNTLTIVDTTSHFSKGKSNEFTQSHAMKHSNPVTLPQTNPVVTQTLPWFVCMEFIDIMFELFWYWYEIHLTISYFHLHISGAPAS